jgi:hypothetical protein
MLSRLSNVQNCFSNNWHCSIVIISIGFIPLFEYGSEWPELDQAPNVRIYLYVALVFFIIGGILIYIGSKRKPVTA